MTFPRRESQALGLVTSLDLGAGCSKEMKGTTPLRVAGGLPNIESGQLLYKWFAWAAMVAALRLEAKSEPKMILVLPFPLLSRYKPLRKKALLVHRVPSTPIPQVLPAIR
jgi:hypothetical protein